MSDPIGVRCNNPGNLERTEPPIPWKGLTGYEGVECVFATPEAGWRAMCRDLLNAQRLHERNTIAEIITPYAPPTENDTKSYIEDVCGRLQTAPDVALDLMDVTTLSRLAQAMAYHEQGADYWPPAMIIAAASEVIAEIKGETT
jgi:hypothetical protein